MTALVTRSSDVQRHTRAKVMALEAALRTLPQVELKIVHYFCKGLYIREMHAPADVTLTGKIHRTEHLCVLSQGDVSVSTGVGVRRLRAPYILQSPPGEKRAIYVHQDAIWANLHRTDETDLEKIELELIAPTFEDLP